MDTQILEFVSAHGTVVVIAVTLLAATGIVQWRKAHVAELDCDLKEGLLQQGLPVAEIVMLLQANAATRPGLLEQFGALSGGAKTGLVIATVMTVPGMVGIIVGSLESHAFRSHVHQHQFCQPPAPRDTEPVRFTLIPERPIVFMQEAGTANCRVYLTGGYP